tara:strand:- start:87 stop:512 length:426 start_codon:yes stop_codon:yes gene_type:complete
MTKRKAPSEEQIISKITDAGEVPDWLDEKLADILIQEGEGLNAVAEHLKTNPKEPLPLDLLAELLLWLKDMNGIKAVRADNSEGRFDTWLHFVIRLMKSGYKERQAIEYVKGYFGLPDEYENLKRRFQDYKKYLRKKDDHQ